MGAKKKPKKRLLIEEVDDESGGDDDEDGNDNGAPVLGSATDSGSTGTDDYITGSAAGTKDGVDYEKLDRRGSQGSTTSLDGWVVVKDKETAASKPVKVPESAPGSY